MEHHNSSEEPTNSYDLNPDLDGAFSYAFQKPDVDPYEVYKDKNIPYSEWEQPAVPLKSNHHTYLVDENGKKHSISQHAFREKYESATSIDLEYIKSVVEGDIAAGDLSMIHETQQDISDLIGNVRKRASQIEIDELNKLLAKLQAVTLSAPGEVVDDADNEIKLLIENEINAAKNADNRVENVDTSSTDGSNSDASGTYPDNIFSFNDRKKLQETGEKKKSRLRRKLAAAAMALSVGAALFLGRDSVQNLTPQNKAHFGTTPIEQSIPSKSYAGIDEYDIEVVPSVGSEEINATPIAIVSEEPSEISTPVPTVEATEPAITATSTVTPETTTSPAIELAPYTPIETAEEASPQIVPGGPTVTPETDREGTEPKIVPIAGSTVVPGPSEDQELPIELGPEEAGTVEGDEPVKIVPVEGGTNATGEEDAPGKAESSIDRGRLGDFFYVAPGDGITQVLGKVITRAGYKGITPERLYELYNILIDKVGPYGIFKGDSPDYSSVYWDDGAEEYRIRDVGVEQFSGEAADIILNELGDQ